MPAKIVRSLQKRASEVLVGVAGRDLILRKLARSYLSGQGIEIGALRSPEKVPRGVRVRYVDSQPAENLGEIYRGGSTRPLVRVDIIDDGGTLATIPDGSQDFVIACHVVEHLQDPIGAIGNMFRVVKASGVLFLSIPDKRYTFDKDREVTPFDHILRDYREGPAWSRQAHFDEWSRVMLGARDDDQLRAATSALAEGREPIHFHVWTQAEILELIVGLQRLWPSELEMLYRLGNEVVFVLRKAAATGAGRGES